MRTANAFALLSDDAEDDHIHLDDDEDEEFKEVSRKPYKKGQQTSQQPRPAVPTRDGPASTSRAAAGNGPAAQSSTAAAAPNQAPAAAPRAERPQTHTADGRPMSDEYYRSFQKVYRHVNGVCALLFHKTEIVLIAPNGDVKLTTGGYKTATTFSSMNDALRHLHMHVGHSGNVGSSDWFVLDAEGSSHSYVDGMVLHAKMPADRGRGDALLAAFKDTPIFSGEGVARQVAWHA
jgi:hypothetical protein